MSVLEGKVAVVTGQPCNGVGDDFILSTPGADEQDPDRDCLTVSGAPP